MMTTRMMKHSMEFPKGSNRVETLSSLCTKSQSAMYVLYRVFIVHSFSDEEDTEDVDEDESDEDEDEEDEDGEGNIDDDDDDDDSENLMMDTEEVRYVEKIYSNVIS